MTIGTSYHRIGSKLLERPALASQLNLHGGRHRSPYASTDRSARDEGSKATELGRRSSRGQHRGARKSKLHQRFQLSERACPGAGDDRERPSRNTYSAIASDASCDKTARRTEDAKAPTDRVTGERSASLPKQRGWQVHATRQAFSVGQGNALNSVSRKTEIYRNCRSNGGSISIGTHIDSASRLSTG